MFKKPDVAEMVSAFVCLLFVDKLFEGKLPPPPLMSCSF